MQHIEKIYCQGVKGAYSHIAAAKLSAAPTEFVKTFEDVFCGVLSGTNFAGVVPVENSTAGAVGEVLSLMVKYDLYIARAIDLSIRHNLCARENIGAEDVKKIYSHHQALMQCSGFLSGLLAQPIETANTAISAAMAAKEGDLSAAICSAEAANIYGLNIIAEDICNSKSNLTRFALICGKEQYNRIARSGLKRLNAAFYLEIKNRSGALYEALNYFKKLDINLISLHSLPIAGEIWSYGFYVETDPVTEQKVQDALSLLHGVLEKVKLLGTFEVVSG